MPQPRQVVYRSHGGLAAVADDLVVPGFQGVEARVGHAVKIFFQKAQGLLVAAPQHDHAVHVIVRDEPEGVGVVDVDGGEGVFEHIAALKRLLLDAARQGGEEEVGFGVLGPGKQAGHGAGERLCPLAGALF